MAESPNVVFVFADQWRAQDCGFEGNNEVKTPNLDQLAPRSIHVTNAVAGTPVCTPYRASLLTGQYPLAHGLFQNDVRLAPEANTIGKNFRNAGCRTAYIGKWHLDGEQRLGFIPPDRQQGFEYWKVLNCTHDYNNSVYYEHDSSVKKVWEVYDAFAQTDDACRYIEENHGENPFFLMLSWGPPHAPYQTAPESYQNMYDPEKLSLRPNVPEEAAEKARKNLAGYYAHITALDACIGQLMASIQRCGIENDTVFVFTSDHGDMHGSQGTWAKQQPWEESIRVPFLLHYPALHGEGGVQTRTVLDAPDIFPTLMSICNRNIPDTVEGTDKLPWLLGERDPDETDALLSCPVPFGQWTRDKGGREYRGIRTTRYVYVRTLDGPWLLYDLEVDPYEMHNVCNDPEYKEIQEKLENRLRERLQETNDEFLPGQDYIERLLEWGYEVDEKGTVRYYR